MIFRSLLILFALALPATALAGSYRVIFGGAITAMDNGAPDSFSIGERVLGTYEFDTEPEWTHTVVTQVAGVVPLAGQPTSYTGFPSSSLVFEVISTGPLLLMTESGFVATDTSSEIFAVWNTSGSRFIGGNSVVAFVSNQGRFSNGMAGGNSTARTLHTFLGPVAAGIELFVEGFDLSPAQVADNLGQEHVVGTLLSSVNFPGIRGGVISYGKSSGDFSGHYPAAVRFDIDTLRIVAIPEPATMGLLLFAMVAAGAGRRVSR